MTIALILNSYFRSDVSSRLTEVDKEKTDWLPVEGKEKPLCR